MNPQELPKTSKFYSRCTKCDIEKTVGGGYHPLGGPKVKTVTCENYVSKSRKCQFVSKMIYNPTISNL